MPGPRKFPETAIAAGLGRAAGLAGAFTARAFLARALLAGLCIFVLWGLAFTPPLFAAGDGAPGGGEKAEQVFAKPENSEKAVLDQSGAEKADSGQSAYLAGKSYSMGSYVWGLGILFLMLALMWFALWFLKRRGGFKMFGQSPDLRMEGRMALGRNQQIFILNFEGRRLLIGATDHHITLLTESDDYASASADFKQVLEDANGS